MTAPEPPRLGINGEPTPVPTLTGALTVPRPGAARTEETEQRVYRLLRDSGSVPAAARRAGISREMANRYARRLLRAGVLQVVTGTRSPRTFERGPKAWHYEEQMQRGEDRPGGRGPVGARCHNFAFRWRYEARPRHEPPWTHTWRPSGVPNHRIFVERDGRRWRIEDRRGKTRRSLLVALEGDVVEFDPGRLAEVQGRVMHDAARLLREFAQHYGYDLRGPLLPCGKAHYAMPLDARLPAEGNPERDADAIDGSLHDAGGPSEYESAEPERVARAMRLEERVRLAEARSDAAAAAAETAVRLAERARIERARGVAWRNT